MLFDFCWLFKFKWKCHKWCSFIFHFVNCCCWSTAVYPFEYGGSVSMDIRYAPINVGVPDRKFLAVDLDWFNSIKEKNPQRPLYCWQCCKSLPNTRCQEIRQWLENHKMKSPQRFQAVALLSITENFFFLQKIQYVCVCVCVCTMYLLKISWNLIIILLTPTPSFYRLLRSSSMTNDAPNKLR